MASTIGLIIVICHMAIIPSNGSFLILRELWTEFSAILSNGEEKSPFEKEALPSGSFKCNLYKNQNVMKCSLPNRTLRISWHGKKTDVIDPSDVSVPVECRVGEKRFVQCWTDHIRKRMITDVDTASSNDNLEDSQAGDEPYSSGYGKQSATVTENSRDEDISPDKRRDSVPTINKKFNISPMTIH